MRSGAADTVRCLVMVEEDTARHTLLVPNLGKQADRCGYCFAGQGISIEFRVGDGYFS